MYDVQSNIMNCEVAIIFGQCLMKMKNVWTFFGIYFYVNIREVWMDVIMKIHNLIYIETLITLSYHLLFPLKHNPEIGNYNLNIILK